MEATRFAAEIVRCPEGTYVATCAAAPGCLGTRPTRKPALHALRKAVQDFLEPPFKHCSQVGISVLVVASGIHASPPSQQKSGAMPVGWMERNPRQ